jgi:hypothetical protein
MVWQDAFPAIVYMAAGGALVFSAIVLPGCHVSLALFVPFDKRATSMVAMMAGVCGAMWYGQSWAGRAPE